LAAEGGDDAVVDAAHPDGGVGQVDDGVAAAVQGGQRGAHGDGLAGADLAGDHADARSAMHQPMRARASLWALWRCSMPGARSRPNGVREKPYSLNALGGLVIRSG
jgi:hypothetical protein